MTPFQAYAHARWVTDFPQWACLREDLDAHGAPFDSIKSDSLQVRYQVPSPANPDNILWVVFTPDDIVVKYAVPGSHEHYDPDFYGGPHFDGDRSVFWPQAYEDAISEYVLPVIQDRMFTLNYGRHSALVCNVEEFLQSNRLRSCQYASWSCPAKELKLENMA